MRWDRAGLGAKQALDVSVELKPYERVLERMPREAITVEVMNVPESTVIDGERSFNDRVKRRQLLGLAPRW